MLAPGQSMPYIEGKCSSGGVTPLPTGVNRVSHEIVQSQANKQMRLVNHLHPKVQGK